MTSNAPRGTSSTAMLIAAELSDDLLTSPDGAVTNSITANTEPDDTSRLLPTDTLAHFSLGPC